MEAQRKRLAQQISDCLTQFSASLTGPVTLGLSGGKDSFSLMHLLGDLGVQVLPAVVDLAYPDFPASEIAAAAVECGFETKVLSARNHTTLVGLPSRIQSTMRTNLEFLADPGTRTPCGACSQAKRDLLSAEARHRGANWIVLGHHREDLLATLLKDYFAYRFFKEYGRFEAGLFRSFVESCDIDLLLLKDLVDGGLAATMSIRLPIGRNMEILRPMAFVEEAALESFIQSLGARTFGSGCAHASLRDGQTPTKREIVHRNLRKRLSIDPELGDRLLSVALRSIDSRGRCRFNPRALRSEALPGFDNQLA